MAKMIPAEIVEEVWQKISLASVESAQEMNEEFRRKHPTLMDYLVTVVDKNFNDYDAQIVYYLGIVTWQIIIHGDLRVHRVTVGAIERAEKKNFEQLAMLTSTSPIDLVSATQTILENYPEPNILRYIIEALYEVDDEDDEHSEPPMSEEALGMAFLYLKTILDAMIASRGRVRTG